jgi:hypothetical protein
VTQRDVAAGKELTGNRAGSELHVLDASEHEREEEHIRGNRRGDCRPEGESRLKSLRDERDRDVSHEH